MTVSYRERDLPGVSFGTPASGSKDPVLSGGEVGMEEALMLVGKSDEDGTSEPNGLRVDAINSHPARPAAGVIGRRKHNLRAQPTQIVGRAGELKSWVLAEDRGMFDEELITSEERKVVWQ